VSGECGAARLQYCMVAVAIDFLSCNIVLDCNVLYRIVPIKVATSYEMCKGFKISQDANFQRKSWHKPYSKKRKYMLYALSGTKQYKSSHTGKVSSVTGWQRREEVTANTHCPSHTSQLATVSNKHRTRLYCTVSSFSNSTRP